MNKVKTLTAKLIENSNAIYQNNELKLTNLCSTLDALSPLKTLQRGFFSVTKDGNMVTSVENVKVGDEISIRGKDGTIGAGVKKIDKEK